MVRHINQRIALLGAAATLVAPVAHAQQATPTPAPTPTIITPGIEHFSLPASGTQTQPQPQPTRARAAVATPSSTPAPTPRETSPVARPVVQRPASASPTRATPTPSPTLQPTASATPELAPVSSATAPAASETPAPAPVPATQGGLPWLWMLIGAALAAAIGAGGWLLGRRGRRVEAQPQAARPTPPSPAPVPVARPVPPPPGPVPAAPVIAAAPDPIAIEFYPRSIEVSDQGAVLDFEIDLRNLTGAQADGLKVSLLLASANPEQDALIASFQGSSALPASGPPVDLPAGEGGRIPGKLAIEADRIHVVQVGGRPMFVPIFLIDLRWRGGLSLRHHGAAFMVGTAGQGGKLGPIWLDRGAQRVGGLSATRYQVQARPVAA